MRKSTSGFITLPAAIVIAATIIAIAIIWVKRPVEQAAPTKDANNPAQAINMRPISKDDHILGNPNAPIIMLEYSDPSCPYCKVFGPTMIKVMDTYGASGTVAWAYRSFPLSFHPNAVHESEAMECAGDQGGNEKYWAFLKRLYEITPSVSNLTPNGLDQAQLPVIAKYVGLDVTKFNACLSSEKYKARVEADQADGTNAGVNGTPHTVFVLKKPAGKAVDGVISAIATQLQLPPGSLYLSTDRTKLAMSGAMPFEVIQKIVDSILNK